LSSFKSLKIEVVEEEVILLKKMESRPVGSMIGRVLVLVLMWVWVWGWYEKQRLQFEFGITSYDP
jgi:hypothetical protein